MNQKFLNAPILQTMADAPSPGGSVLYCPSGVQDFRGLQYVTAGGNKMIANRTDGLGASPWRAKSFYTGNIVDTWYGINADWGTKSAMAGQATPLHFLPTTDTIPNYSIQAKLATIKYSAEVVFLFDGTFYDLFYDANRLNARHGKRKQTNLLFFDGHAATFDTAGLPGGIGDANASNPFGSKAAMVPWPTPKFRTDQN